MRDNRDAAIERLMGDVEALCEALRPFADFAVNVKSMPDDFVVTMGSPMARRQLTMGDCRRALAVMDKLEAVVRPPRVYRVTRKRTMTTVVETRAGSDAEAIERFNAGLWEVVSRDEGPIEPVTAAELEAVT